MSTQVRWFLLKQRHRNTPHKALSFARIPPATPEILHSDFQYPSQDNSTLYHSLLTYKKNVVIREWVMIAEIKNPISVDIARQHRWEEGRTTHALLILEVEA